MDILSEKNHANVIPDFPALLPFICGVLDEDPLSVPRCDQAQMIICCLPNMTASTVISTVFGDDNAPGMAEACHCWTRLHHSRAGSKLPGALWPQQLSAQAMPSALAESSACSPVQYS